MSCVQYWPVGTASDSRLSMTPAQICQALLADWLPTLPFAASRSVLGWPFFLVASEPGVPIPYLCIESMAGWSDRQWKGVLSWMFGIAGTRRVLDTEGYVWVAPLSAFYPDRRQNVAIPSWNTSYPPSILQTLPDPSNPSRLRPDYIAARPLKTGGVEFALVESKGTSSALNSMIRCPSDWARQARNAIVKLNGSVVACQRHMVVATRCNPNALRQRSRRLQVRAWNSSSNTLPHDSEVMLEIASAFYSGLCRNLGLWANLQALQLSVSARSGIGGVSDRQLAHIESEADIEFAQKGRWHLSGEGGANFEIPLDTGTIYVQLTDTAISLIRSLRSPAQEDAAARIMDHQRGLTDWYSKKAAEHTELTDVAIDKSGFSVTVEKIHYRMQ